MKSPAMLLRNIYNKLYQAFGPQRWWPGDTAFEIVIGAILTQNTNWQNVAKAIVNLKKNKLLTPAGIKNIPRRRLAAIIRPTGYYNIKAKRVKEFINFLFAKYNGSLQRMFAKDIDALRQELLTIHGIGPETADSIILYGANKPIFVVDAYTKRVFSRHNIFEHRAAYSQIQSFFMDNLPPQTKHFNEYHALIVRLGKEFCKTKPNCGRCPLKGGALWN